MCFYFETLDNPYDICLAIDGNNHHSHLPVGALQLVDLPSMCASLTKRRTRTATHYVPQLL
jgi:hypothetical protein